MGPAPFRELAPLELPASLPSRHGHRRLDVDDWIARAEQSPDEARQVRELLGETVGTRRFGGRRVRRDEAGKLKFIVRYMIVVATRRERLPVP